MAIGTTSLSYGIATEYIADYIVPAFQRNLVWDQLVNKVQFRETTYDGKGAKVRIVLDDDYQESTTTISQTGDGGRTETSYQPTAVDVTIAERGKLSWTLTGRGQLEFFDDANGRVMNQVAVAAVRSYDSMIAEVAVAGGTASDDSAGSSSTRWRVINPDASHKPGGTLTSDHVMKAVIDLQSNDVLPVVDGLYLAVYHPAMQEDLRNEIVASGMSYTEFSMARQSGSPMIAEYARGAMGIWCGCLWIASNSPAMRVASGASGGGYAYKTLICGMNYLAQAMVPVAKLPWNGEGRRYPIHPFIEMRTKGDSNDNLSRNTKFGFYFVGGAGIAKKMAGFIYVSKSSFSALPV